MKRSRNLTIDQVLDAVQTHGTPQAAADSLGCTRDAVNKRLREHRARLDATAEAARLEQQATDAAELAEAEAKASARERRVTSAPTGDWRAWAECLEEDPDLFFPVGSTGPALVQIEEAKAVCRRCDVVGTCLRWALDTNQDAGVWGGLSEDERRSLKRREARTRRAS